MPRIDQPLKIAISERASDVHISSQEPIRIRVDGNLKVASQGILTAEQVKALLFEILSEEEKQRFIQNKNLDKSISTAVGNFRVNFFFTRRGPAAVFRTIPMSIPTITELGFPEAIARLIDLPKGLVLVTGPTGSGKSTTLASLVNHLNLNHKYHIITIEDPIEFIHKSEQSLISQREIGTSCHTYADALKFALREDPDAILVGELRDLETISLALTAAETGHLVFGTLHTRGATASVDRIVDCFPENQQPMIRTMLSESLAAVISQCLIKRADGHGRVAAYEILIVNTAISNLIREGKTFQMHSIIQTARKEGMVLLEQSILELVQKKMVKAEDAAVYLKDPSIIGAFLKNPNNSTAPEAKQVVPISKLPAHVETKTIVVARPKPALEMDALPELGTEPENPPEDPLKYADQEARSFATYSLDELPDESETSAPENPAPPTMAADKPVAPVPPSPAPKTMPTSLVPPRPSISRLPPGKAPAPPIPKPQVLRPSPPLPVKKVGS